MPKNIQPTDKEPYTRNDVIKILAACDAIGHYGYERLRARAMVLLLRYTHRFRHTLATELLEAGGSLEDVAEVLGNSPNIIRKHYAKWSRLRQERISTLMRTVFDTPLIHEKRAPVNS
jgi:hypothetical protein